jgi:hypothetical protein
MPAWVRLELLSAGTLAASADRTGQIIVVCSRCGCTCRQQAAATSVVLYLQLLFMLNLSS